MKRYVGRKTHAKSKSSLIRELFMSKTTILVALIAWFAGFILCKLLIGSTIPFLNKWYGMPISILIIFAIYVIIYNLIRG